MIACRWGTALAWVLLSCGGVDGGAELFDRRPERASEPSSDVSQPQSTATPSATPAVEQAADPPQPQSTVMTSAPPQAQGPGTPPDEDEPAVSVISVERARYDSDDLELEVRGEVSSESVTLVAEFGERVEPLQNDQGRFRETFQRVTEPPVQIVIVASDGATTRLNVDVRD